MTEKKIDMKAIFEVLLSEPEKQYIADLTLRLVTEPDIENFKWTMTDAAALKAIIPFLSGMLEGRIQPNRPGIMCNTFNMNVHCEAKLTRYGLKILTTKAPEMYLNDYSTTTGKLRTTLWHFFELYGEHMVHGMPEVPFVDNKITLASE